MPIEFIDTRTSTGTVSITGGTYGNLYIGSTGGTTGEINVCQGKNFSPEIAFKFIKKKFSVIGQRKYENRLKKLKQLAEKYAKLGHNALSDKFTGRIKEEMAYAELSGASIDTFIDKDIIDKIKWRVKGGHISDTPFDKYTRVIPTKILKRKKVLDKMKVFSSFVVYHYYNEELEKKIEKKEPTSPSEKSAMRDPILFGTREDMPGKLFYIDSWEDEYCSLTFSDVIDVLELEEEDYKIPLLDKFFKKFTK